VTARGLEAVRPDPIPMVARLRRAREMGNRARTERDHGNGGPALGGATEREVLQ
jgi:hypothetical protein